MECLEYTDANELFTELVNDIKGDSQESSKIPQVYNIQLKQGACTR